MNSRKKRDIDTLRGIVKYEVGSLLKEDLARGIPDFVLSQISSDAAESMKQHLRRHITQVAQDPSKQRQMLGAANVVLEELEEEMIELLRNKLDGFLRRT